MTLTDPTPRQDWMGLLARSAPARLAALLPDLPAHALLRGPEVGAVMVQGRIGGTGQPFNLGEMTVTRCSVRLEGGAVGGAVGHAHVQGRDKTHALRAAVMDALLQGGADALLQGGASALVQDGADALRAAVLVPLRAEEAAAHALRAAKAAATKVEFFTLVRGEDA